MCENTVTACCIITLPGLHEGRLDQVPLLQTGLTRFYRKYPWLHVTLIVPL